MSRKVVFFVWLALLSTLHLVTGCHTPPASRYHFMPPFRGALFQYPWLPDQATGIAVSGTGRIFVSFPRWDPEPRYSVAEVLADGTLRPYPDIRWNSWKSSEQPHRQFVCVQSVFADDRDNLWILDPASPDFKGVVPGGAKLVRVNLANDRVEQVIPFDAETATPSSYLNDVRVDTGRNIAYITDSGTGAIIVTDLTDGTSRRLLAGHPSTQADEGYVPVIGGRPLLGRDGRPPQIHADGIALDPTGEYLYYHPLTGRGLFRIRTTYLRNKLLTPDQVGSKVEKVLETGAADGMIMDRFGILYITALEKNGIIALTPEGDLLTIVEDERLQWPDSMSISPGDVLYFTDSQIHRMPRFNDGRDERERPYNLYKVPLLPFR